MSRKLDNVCNDKEDLQIAFNCTTANFASRKGLMVAKENRSEGQCQTIKEGMAPGDSKMASQLLKALTKTGQHKTAVIKDGNGCLFNDSAAVLKQTASLYCPVTCGNHFGTVSGFTQKLRFSSLAEVRQLITK